MVTGMEFVRSVEFIEFPGFVESVEVVESLGVGWVCLVYLALFISGSHEPKANMDEFST